MTITAVKTRCPRCNGNLMPDYEDVFCLQCGWREPGAYMTRKEYEKEWHKIKEIEDGMNGYHVSQNCLASKGYLVK